MFTARYAPSPCTNQTRLDFKRLNSFTSFAQFLLYIDCSVQHNISHQAKDVEYLRAYRGADKCLARPGRKQARKHVWDARDFNNIEMRAVIKFFSPLQGKAPKEIHASTPRERPGTHCTGGWVGPRAGLDGRKISSPQGFDPGPSSPQSVAIPTELPGSQTHKITLRKYQHSYQDFNIR